MAIELTEMDRFLSFQSALAYLEERAQAERHTDGI